MKNEAMQIEKLSIRNVNAIHVIGSTIGVLFGLSGINHGFFEFLQGNAPTDGLVIHAIGEAQRYWLHGTEDAFTVVPNFMISGILSMFIGVLIVVWSVRYLRSRHGTTVFLILFILLFLTGGGIGQLAIFLPAWAFLTRMDKPLTWWKKVLPESIWPFLSNIWIFSLMISSIFLLIGIELAIFGYFPGITDPDVLQNTAMSLVFFSALLNILTFIAGIGHELNRMY
jgi:hypothetical protein